ncbi:MAG TPA: hypothetical protein PKE06_26675, partial [Flavilitoribacter sp.]|nr:hypothetical protein [Flavilitoribacter sp.]HMQ86462.1 hypothetical protein [Flavilitoribacter sp.]
VRQRLRLAAATRKSPTCEIKHPPGNKAEIGMDCREESTACCNTCRSISKAIARVNGPDRVECESCPVIVIGNTRL